MRRFWALPLRRQLVIASLLLLVPVLVAVIWSGVSTFRERRDELGEQARIVARTTAAYVNRDLLYQDQLAERLSKDPAVLALDEDAIRELFGRMTGRAPILRLALADQADRQIVVVDVSGESLDHGNWPAEVRAQRERVVEGMRTAPSGRLRYVVLAYPVTGLDGQFLASLAIYVNLQSLRDAFDALALPALSVVNVVDHEGRLIARSLDPDRFIGQSLASIRGSSQVTPAPTHVATGLDGVSRMYGEAIAPAGPWIVNVGIPTAVAIERSGTIWARSLAILAFGLVGWLAVALIVSRRLGQSVSHLDAAAQRIAAGDFSPIRHRPMASRELADFQEAFDLMLRRFNESRLALDAQMGEERRMRRELESLQGQVIRQERLAAVGQLVSGVAHEINNPLQAILGFSELLQMQDDVPDGVKADLRLIQKESARACAIIRNLALFARQTPGEAAPLWLKDVIASVAELRQRRLESEDIHLIVDDTSDQQVSAVMTELQQVVLNFVVNAEQSILASSHLPGRVVVRAFDRGGRVVLEVEDSGPGVPREHEARLFQPFFTTKPVGQGTGLGLSVSYGIIDSLGGHIGYRRSEAGGSIFYFELPAARVSLDETA